jgi:hypothetical protein
MPGKDLHRHTSYGTALQYPNRQPSSHKNIMEMIDRGAAGGSPTCLPVPLFRPRAIARACSRFARSLEAPVWPRVV